MLIAEGECGNEEGDLSLKKQILYSLLYYNTEVR